MATADYLSGGVHDGRLKSRLLRSLTRDLEDTGGLQLGYVLEKIKIHGLLIEASDGKMETKVLNEWRLSLDAWMEQLVLLISDKMPQKCWAGTCLLGVTVEECNSNQIISKYAIWFEKLLHNIQGLSNTCFINEATCATLSDLFTRLANLPQVKKDVTTFANRVMQPLLQLINDNPVIEGPIDLLCTLVKFYPYAVFKYYDKVESTLATQIMSVNCNLDVLKKYASVLALLPHAKGDSDYWSIMMQKILININTLLNEALEGLEEEGKGSEIMKLLVPSGKEPPGPLGSEIKNENINLRATKKLSHNIVPILSSLTYSCSIMLKNPYPSQVTVPIRVLLTLIKRVLSVDGSLVTKSVLPCTTSLYQELLCAELPALHLSFLDLLIAIIKGLRSQILPHAANVARLVTDYFIRVNLPFLRAKVYYTLELLLNSMGVGMSLYLAEDLVSNALNDLIDGQENNNNNNNNDDNNNNKPSKLFNEALMKNSPKKRKRVRGPSQKEEINKEEDIINDKKIIPISIKIAALGAIETLLSVGGSVKSESWRPEVDRVLINVAKNAFNAAFVNKLKTFNAEESDEIQSEFRLVALKALLASLLSPCHVRPPYLSQGLQLFQKGKLEKGTKIGVFCEKALLSLEVLIHPRDLPLIELNFPGNGFPGFQNPTLLVANEPDKEEMYYGWQGSSDDEKQLESPVKDSTGEKPKFMEIEEDKVDHDIEGEKEEENKNNDYLSEKEEENKNNDNLSTENDEIKLSIEDDEDESGDIDNYLDNVVSLNKYDSDSDSVGSLPDIVDVDPDSD